MKLFFFLRVAMLVVFFTACNQAPRNEVRTPRVAPIKLTDWVVEEGDVCNFKHPADWSASFNEDHLLVVVRGPMKAHNDSIADNVTLLTNELSPEYSTLERFARLSEYQIKHLVDHSEIIKSEPILSGDLEGHHMEFMADFNDRTYLYHQNYYVKNGLGYILTLTMEMNATLEEQKVAEDVFNSFVMKF